MGTLKTLNRSIIACLCILTFASFSINAQNSFDIYIYDVKKGTTIKATQFDSFDEYNPSFSPNSKYIVHDVLNSHNLYITEIATGISTPLLGGEGGDDARWSGNGSFIVFDRDPSGGGLYWVAAEGGTAQLITAQGRDGYPLSNSDLVVYHNFHTNTVNSIGLDGTGDKVLTPGNTPTLSNNGKHLAYIYQDQIYTVGFDQNGDLKGLPVQQTNFVNKYPSRVSWSVNGKELTFHIYDGATGDADIYTLDIKTGELNKVLGHTTQPDYDPVFSKDGRFIAYSSLAMPDFHASNNNGKGPASAPLSEPEAHQLSAYPNPFNPTTNISFKLMENQFVSLKVYNLMGQEVADLLSESKTAGQHTVRFDASGLSSGIYLYRLKTDYRVITRRLLLIK